MKNTDILGGVSPLKARQKTRGGREAGIATTTATRRGGFGKSKGARGAGGRNVGGYNVQTRFKVEPWKAPSDQSGPSIFPNKPYSYTKDNQLVINDPTKATEYKTDPDIVTKKGEKVPYENWEKACHEDRKAAMKAGLHGLSWNGQAAFDAECAGYEAHTKKPDYVPSGGKTVETETRTGGQKWKRICDVVDGKNVNCGEWEKV